MRKYSNVNLVIFILCTWEISQGTESCFTTQEMHDFPVKTMIFIENVVSLHCIFALHSPTERVIMKDGGVGDVGQLGEVPHNIIECVARRPHLHQVQSLLGGQVRPLPAQVIELSSNIRKSA